MKFNLSEHKKLTLDFRKLTLFFVCVYVISIYLCYVNRIISFVGRLSLIAMAGCGAMTVLTEHKSKVNSYAIWCALFIIACGISALYAPIEVNIISGLYTLIIALVIGVVLSVSVKEKKAVETILALMVISSVLLMVYLFATGYIAEYEASDEPAKRFGNELTGNANTFAAIFMIACCATIYFFFAEKKPIIKVVCIIPFLLQLYGLVLAGSRKNILIPFIMIYLISIQMKNKNGSYNVLGKTLITALAIFAGYWLLINVPFLYDNIGYRFESVVEYEKGNIASADTSAMTRNAMRQKALELWSKSPVLGNGLSSFTHISGFNTYSHSNFFEILCNQGLLGFLTYYSYYAYLIYWLIKYWKENMELNKFFIAFVICEAVYEYGAITYNVVPNHIMLALAGIVLSLNNKKDSGKMITNEEIK